MSNEKIIKNRIFIFITTSILFAGIGVYGATNYKASEILYNPSNGDSMTVNEALNELYENTKVTTNSVLHLIGSYNALYSDRTVAINLSSIPNYQNLKYGKTVIAVPTAGYYHIGVASQQWRQWSFSATYNNNTGILTLTLSASDNYNDGYSYNVYVVY